MVLAFSPDSRATLIKLTPRPTPGFAGPSFAPSSGAGKNARERSGRASAITLSSESTTADLLSDWRNVRREEDKRTVPSRTWRARIRPYFIQCVATLQGQDTVDFAFVNFATLSVNGAKSLNRKG